MNKKISAILTGISLILSASAMAQQSVPAAKKYKWHHPWFNKDMVSVTRIDWHSRYVLAWRLSNTIDTTFCVATLTEALEQHGIPEIFNTDQGSQFTSAAFIEVLNHHHIRISMDGKVRALDNIFIERLWRSLKHEEVYSKHYQSLREAQTELSVYFRFYNTDRPHQTLHNRTPGTGLL